MTRARWTLLVPLRATVNGKRRVALPAAFRQQLALTMALDTVAAALSADAVIRVVAVVENPDDGAALAGLGAVDVHLTQTSELNEAILEAASGLARMSAVGPVAVLPADLPSLTGDELDDALDRAGRNPFSVVADADGRGSTLLAARELADLQPKYGLGSFVRHRAAGARPIDLPVTSGLRRDVDQVDHLTAVTGPRTRALLDHDKTPGTVLAERCG